jgi:hypothetical protein
MAFENAKSRGSTIGSAALNEQPVRTGVSQLLPAGSAAPDFSLPFVIDKSGIITWSYRSPVAVNPGADGILHALEDLPK